MGRVTHYIEQVTMSAHGVSRWTAQLRRRTSHGPWLPEVDGLRFVAILSVLLFHLQGQFQHHYALPTALSVSWFLRAAGFGNRGVPLFFVISGFILALPFARHRLFAAPRPSLQRYYLRRLTRLEPPYLLNIIVVALGAALLDRQSWHVLLPHLGASAAYLHYAIFHTPSSINSVAWSLEVEVQFYLLAPALTMMFALRSAALRRAAIASAMLLSAAFQATFSLSQFTLAGDLQYFLAGLLMADLYLANSPASRDARNPARAVWNRIAWDLVSVVGWPAFFLLGDRFTGVWLPALALLLCLAAMRGFVTPRLLRSPAVAIAGGMCYTVYLWHAPVLTVVDRVLRAHPALLPANYLALYLVEAIIKLAAVAIVCLPLFILIERPCMEPDWPRRLIARLRRTLSSAPRLAAGRT